MFLSDSEILAAVTNGMLKIDPFVTETIRNRGGQRVISYGLGPAGYDVRLKPEWKVFKRKQYTGLLLNIHDPKELAAVTDDSVAVIDPKDYDEESLFKVVTGNELVMWPGDYVLAVTLESFALPTNVQGTFFAKSTYARFGLLLNTTNVQPGFEGEVVMEFYNAGTQPLLIRADEGFAQIKFDWCLWQPMRSYRDGGVYQGQTGVQPGKV